MNPKKRKLIAVVGPTASGKTGLAVFLARQFDGEIVSADSRQVFKGLDIGTGKDLAEYGNVKYHLIDICEPEEKFTMFDWLDRARMVIDDIFSRGKLPIIVGGTGLYVQALIEGFNIEKSKCHSEANFLAEESYGKILRSAQDDRNIRLPRSAKPTLAMTDYKREELDEMSLSELQSLAKKLDSAGFAKIDPMNPIRLIRLIERSQSGEEMTKIKPDFEVLQIGINLPREELYKKIDQRADEWFKDGIMEEVEGLLNRGVNPNWLIKLGLEYRIITQYILSTKEFRGCHCPKGGPSGRESSTWQSITGNNSSDAGQSDTNRLPRLERTQRLAMTDKSFNEMKQKMKYAIHSYARRQLTWFRRFPEIKWVKSKNEALEIVKEFVV